MTPNIYFPGASDKFLWKTALVSDLGLTCITVIDLDFFLFVLAVVPQPELLLGCIVLLHKIRNQDCLQQTEQHQSKNHNAVGSWAEETRNKPFLSGSPDCMNINPGKNQAFKRESVPTSGVLLDMDGRMSFRMSSSTEMARSTVTLKPSFSPRWSAIK